MKKTNPIEEIQKLKDDSEFFKQKFKEAKKENLMLRKEVEFLKKNLESMKTRTLLLL